MYNYNTKHKRLVEMNSTEAEKKITEAIRIARKSLKDNNCGWDLDSVSRLAAVIFKDLEI